jgi:hypothetical protein
MYFEDLTPYQYWSDYSIFSTPLAIISRTLNVGWLDIEYPFNRKQSSDDFLDKLFKLSLLPTMETRGYHQCPFCPISTFGLEVERNGQKIILGGAEIRVTGSGWKKYAAPDLIYHYVEAHDYYPPEEFIKAVLSSE